MNIWGHSLRLSIFGESHGKAVGVVVDGLPPGEDIDFEEIDREMQRRAPGRSGLATPRQEQDQVEILSGLLDGRTTGAPICGIIYNNDARPDDYDGSLLRPGHADWTAMLKYGGHADKRGGGHFSGRLTAPLVFAGSLAKQVLERYGIEVYGRIAGIGPVEDKTLTCTPESWKGISNKAFPAFYEDILKEEIIKARDDGDSVGGIVEAVAFGLPGGLGEPFFGSMESVIASLLFSVPAVKGVEFGDGFGLAAKRGSEANDELAPCEGEGQRRKDDGGAKAGGSITSLSNHNGGILGGITNGMPLVVRAAIKPTPSITREQRTVDAATMEPVTLKTEGRHDPCIVPRAVPVVEAAVALCVLDRLLAARSTSLGEGVCSGEELSGSVGPGEERSESAGIIGRTGEERSEGEGPGEEISESGDPGAGPAEERSESETAGGAPGREDGRTNIVLTGLSGSGKSDLGRDVAERFSMPFFDMDEEIEKLEGASVSDIFKFYGEERFRDLETACAKAASAGSGMVIATGGGVVLRNENILALRKNGLIVFLDRPPEDIAKDIDCNNRPLLAGGEDALFKMAVERRPLYISSADVALPCNNGRQEALEALTAVIRGENPGKGFAVIGEPIIHTLSPVIHGLAFESLGVRDAYEAIHVPKGRLGSFLEKARWSGLKGFNVTQPHKKDIIPFLDEIEGEAALCGAVNTVVVRDGKLYGYNTDMPGLAASLQEDGAVFGGARVVIFGTGGAAGAITFKAAREGAESITVLGRSPEKAEEIRENIKKAMGISIATGGTDPETMEKAAAGAELFINATPLGMGGSGQDFPSFGFLKAMPRRSFVCDIVYSPPRTALLREAASLGLKTQNGLGMLIYQALLADELFIGQTLDKPALFQIITNALLSNRKEGRSQ